MFPVAETATGVRLQILVVGELGADELLPGGRVVVLVLGDTHQTEGVGAHHAAPLLQPALLGRHAGRQRLQCLGQAADELAVVGIQE